MAARTVRVPGELDARVRAAARRRSISTSEAWREALELYVSDAGGPVAETCLDLVADLVGTVEGPRDLSTNKEHLRDFGR